MPLSNPYRNIPAILTLADFLATAKFPFAMETGTVASCHTPGCIAGHAAALWPECQREFRGYTAVKENHAFFCDWSVDAIAEKLGINTDTATFLFQPEDHPYVQDADIAMSDISRSDAVAELHRLAFEGEVTWNAVPTPFSLYSMLPPQPHEVPVYLLASPEGFFWLANGDPVGPFPTAELAALDCEA